MKKLLALLKKYPRVTYYVSGYLALTFAILFFFNAPLMKGHIVFGDIDFGFILEGYAERVGQPWNSLWSNPNFFNLSRIPIIIPLYYVFLFLGISASFFVKFFIYLLLITSAYTMFVLITHILKDEVKKEKIEVSNAAIFFAAFFAGGFYALNPWVVMRIQHIFLLVGYALLPLIFHLVVYITESHLPNDKYKNWKWKDRVKAMFKPDFKIFLAIALASFFWAVAVGAVHYLFFTFFLVIGWGIYKVIINYLKQRYDNIVCIIVRIFYVGVLLAFFLAYLFFTQIGASLIQNVAPPSINTLDSVNLLGRHSRIDYVLYLISYWWSMFDLNDLSLLFYAGGGMFLAIIFIGSFLRLHNRFVVFFLMWTIVFAFLSTGTQGPLVNVLYWLIFGSPVAGISGFIFRDPNKLVGLMAFGYALLLGLNLGGLIEYLYVLFKRKQKELLAIKTVFYKDRESFNYFYIPFLLGPLLLVTGFYFYIQPVDQQFFKHFYSPVEIPREYLDINEWTKEQKGDYKTIWFPRNEKVLSPNKEFAVADWNNGKATSSIDIFSAQTKTYNTTEGTTVYMTHLYDFVSNLLELGRSDVLMKYLSTLNIKNVNYHNDIQGLEEMAANSLATLSMQPDIAKIGKIGKMYFFQNTHPSEYFHLYSNVVLSTHGLSAFNSLGTFREFDFKRYAMWFLESDLGQNMIDHLAKGDILHYRFKNDLILSQATDDEMIIPFDYVNYSDSFTRWAKLNITTSDWKWHLDHLGIENWPWDFDYQKGFVFTYAPKMLALEPHQKAMEMGDLFIDSDHFLDQESDFFNSEDTERLEVDFAPTSIYDNLPFIKGEISRGTVDYWKVTTSDYVDVKPENGYAFAFTVSGRYTNKIHGKIKYFDEDENELAVSYVSAPRQVHTFNFVRFTGQFITPPKAKKMKIQLWTFQQPKHKVYWWLHDLKIRDLHEHIEPNVIEIDKEIEKSGKYVAYARIFHNKAGGDLSIRIGPHEKRIVTKVPEINQFYWQKLGEFDLKEGTIPVEIENLEGFNAVNLIALMPKEKFVEYENKIEETAKKTRELFLLEGENDFLQEGNVQSKKYHINLSNGRGVRFNDGVLTASMDVIEEGDYSIYLDTEKGKKFNSLRNVSFFLYTSNNNLLYSRRLNLESPTGTSLESVSAGKVHLFPGRFIIKVVLEDLKESLLHTSSMHRFRYHSEWKEKDQYLDTLGDKERNIDCCDCVDLGEDYLVVEQKGDDEILEKIAEGCSCWWVIGASNIAPVEAEEEYLLRFDAKANFARKIHYKLIYLDKNKVFLDYHIVKDTPAVDTYPWFHVERIVAPPKGTRFVQFQIWSRENRFTRSEVGLRDLLFKKYEDLPILDKLLIFEDKEEDDDLKSLFDAPSLSDSFVKNTSLSPYARKATVKDAPERFIVQTAESFTPLWKMQTNGGEYLDPVRASSVVNSFVINKPEGGEDDVEIAFRFLPQQYFVTGSLVTLVSMIIVVIILSQHRLRHWIEDVLYRFFRALFYSPVAAVCGFFHFHLSKSLKRKPNRSSRKKSKKDGKKTSFWKSFLESLNARNPFK